MFYIHSHLSVIVKTLAKSWKYVNSMMNIVKTRNYILFSGIDWLKTYAALFELVSLSKHLNKREQTILIHPKCQKKITNKLRNCPSKSKDVVKLPHLSITPRSVAVNYDWKGDCLFCSKPCVDDQNRSVSS